MNASSATMLFARRVHASGFHGRVEDERDGRAVVLVDALPRLERHDHAVRVRLRRQLERQVQHLRDRQVEKGEMSRAEAAGTSARTEGAVHGCGERIVRGAASFTTAAIASANVRRHAKARVVVVRTTREHEVETDEVRGRAVGVGLEIPGGARIQA